MSLSERNEEEILKTVILLALLIVPVVAFTAPPPPAAVAWFTDAMIRISTKVAKPADAAPEAPGAIGKGVFLPKPIAIDDPMLDQHNGMISFWIKPEWDGNDGKTHRILRIGDPAKNGLLVEKADTGMLRYVMASPTKITAARGDVSNWQSGEWHHISIVWMSDGNKPVGIPLWIDKVCVDAPVGSGNTFLDPSKMTDKQVWIGDITANAYMDELVMRNWFDVYIPKQNPKEKNSQIALVYRDYFRTAPFSKLEIDPEPCQVASDTRVVNGAEKLFGLKGELNGEMVRTVDNVTGYGNWSDFDAKPFIKWTISDPNIATVNADGIVTGKSVGKCMLTAELSGRKATYDLSVISADEPDLDMLYVERLPRYSTKSAKWWPDEGEKVESVAHIGNYGYKTIPAGTVVKFELVPDANGNYKADPGEKAIDTATQTLTAPLGGEQVTLHFPWAWTNNPTWLRVTVDPDNKVSELCEANNQCCELNVGRAFHYGFNEDVLKDDFNGKKVNLVGSFSYYRLAQRSD